MLLLRELEMSPDAEPYFGFTLRIFGPVLLESSNLFWDEPNMSLEDRMDSSVIVLL